MVADTIEKREEEYPDDDDVLIRNCVLPFLLLLTYYYDVASIMTISYSFISLYYYYVSRFHLHFPFINIQSFLLYDHPFLQIRVIKLFQFDTCTQPSTLNSTALHYKMDEQAQLQQIQLLTSTNDDHGGVIIELDDDHSPMDSTTFLSILRPSISHWKHLGKKGVWVKLPIHLVNLVETLVKEGFWYHHAEPKYLMLVHWIPVSGSTIPANASHRVGVGALVVTERREILVVQEKSGRYQGTGFWKFPTGVVDQGEDICVAAVREVKEETGVDSEFVEILAFSQSHKTFFEKSDLYFVCLMRPLSLDIQMQETEIEAAQWMPFDEYAAQPLIEKHELLKVIKDIYLAKVDRQYSGFTPVSTRSDLPEEKTHLYVNAGDMKRCNSV